MTVQYASHLSIYLSSNILLLFIIVGQIFNQKTPPSTIKGSQALCIMYNSNGEMVRFKPKTVQQHLNPKSSSIPDAGIITIEIESKTKKR